jgi:hypothetical protein
VTEAPLAAVFAETFVTVNVTPAGTVTRACSLTFAVNVVVCVLSGRATVVCARATTGAKTAVAARTAVHKHFFIISASFFFVNTGRGPGNLCANS